MGLLTRAAVPPWNGGVPRRHRKSSLRLGNQVDLQVLHCRVHVAALARVLRPVVKVGCDSTERLAHVRRCPPRAGLRGARLCIGVRPGGLKRPAGGGTGGAARLPTTSVSPAGPGRAFVSASLTLTTQACPRDIPTAGRLGLPGRLEDLGWAAGRQTVSLRQQPGILWGCYRRDGNGWGTRM